MISEFLNQYDIHSWQILSIVFVAGFFAGFINTFAGSATAINYFLFSMLGIPLSVANGTVRLGVLMQALTTSTNFYRKGKLNIKKALYVAIPVTMGSIIGAEIAVNIDISVFEKLIGLVLIFLLFLLFYDSERWIKGKAELNNHKSKPWHLLILFCIGIYGGFIHIGTGILLISSFVWLSGYNLVQAAATKIFVVLIYTPFVFAVFAGNSQVEYTIGIATGLGNLFGGLIASNLAIKKGSGFVRYMLVVFISFFSLKLLGFIDF